MNSTIFCRFFPDLFPIRLKLFALLPRRFIADSESGNIGSNQLLLKLSSFLLSGKMSLLASGTSVQLLALKLVFPQQNQNSL